MITVTLTRQNKKGKAVYGTLTFPIGERSFSYPSLENADFLITSGTYPLERTWSPKFKKRLAEIQNVPERTGIRIHMGTKPEHSTGCILTDQYGQSNLDVLLNRLETIYNNEEILLQISDNLPALPSPGSGSGL